MDSLARISLWNMAAEAAGELSACLEEARDRRKRLENAAAVVSPCRWRCLHLDTWPMACQDLESCYPRGGDSTAEDIREDRWLILIDLSRRAGQEPAKSKSSR